MEKILSFIQEIIVFEPVLISDLLAFFSSIILLIITFKSVSNAKKSNEITSDSLKISKEALDLQKQQFKENIKPVLVLYFPHVMTEEKSNFNEKWVSKDISMLFGDYRFSVKNTSNNIAYNARIFVYLHLDNNEWIKYKNYGYNNFGLIFTTNSSYHLDSNEKLKSTIPYHYFKGKIKDFNTDVYILVTYENKVGDIYEEGYLLRQRSSHYGESHVIVSFEPKNMDVTELKEVVLSQKVFLQKHFEKDLTYYFVPK